jgi:cytochrome oxidase Cu insertion factor (SCO1/SenC/PrrC family)
MKRRKWFVGVLLGATLATASCGSEGSAPSVGAPDPAVGESDDGAPVEPQGAGSEAGAGSERGAAYSDRYNFTATTFDGEAFELATYKGTPVVINFWESW